MSATFLVQTYSLRSFSLLHRYAGLGFRVQGYLAQRNLPSLGPCSRAMGPTVVRGGGGQFLMSEVPL